MAHVFLGSPLRWLMTLITLLTGGGLMLLSASEAEIPATPTAPVVVKMEGPGGMDAPSGVEPTPTATPTVAVTSTITVTPTTNVIPAITATPAITAIPRIVVTEVPMRGMSGLAFHPSHLNAGGKCRTAYSASGSLKNHGAGLVTNVTIEYKPVSGEQWVERVEVTPWNWAELSTSKPGRFTVYVYPRENWPQAGKGSEIVIRLTASGMDAEDSVWTAEATFRVRNQCQAAKPDKPSKEIKPTKEPKPTKAPKATKVPKPVKNPKPKKNP